MLIQFISVFAIEMIWIDFWVV